MIKSKGWDWKIVKDDIDCPWKIPSVESYYLLNRWENLNFKNKKSVIIKTTDFLNNL